MDFFKLKNKFFSRMKFFFFKKIISTIKSADDKELLIQDVIFTVLAQTKIFLK